MEWVKSLFPNSEGISETSRVFLRSDPSSYEVTRGRQLREAVRVGDGKTMSQLLSELASVYGKENICFYVGDLIEEQLRLK